MTFDAPLFLGPALETAARVFGLCDRRDGSPSFGCCDRMHWHYRITDFANARMQEAGLLFSLAYAAPLAGNRFHGQERLRNWIRAIWNFWLDHRNSDGSVIEVYPYERSNCATSFTAACFVESVGLLGGAAEWRNELAAAESTFQWLAAHSSPEVANQMAASTLALAGYARLTSNAGMHEAARERRNLFIETVREDGTFPEYGGFDAGYQSITLSALVRVQRLGDDDAGLEDVVRRGETKLTTAIDDLGRTDYQRNARNTQFLYPYGLAARRSKSLPRIEAGLRANVILRPTWMDDRYCIPLAADHLLTAWELSYANDAR
jgi:hypothetical protein